MKKMEESFVFTHRRGFTLIELLVVIAIISMLLAIIMPALKSAKIQAQAVICLSNVKGMSPSWQMYCNDNKAKLPDGHQPRDAGFKKNLYWAEPPQDINGTYTGDSNPTWDDKKRGIEKGVLFPYINEIKAYRCVGDRSQKITPAGQPNNFTYQSYSITGQMNGEDKVSPSEEIRKTIAYKVSEITNPGKKFVFVENSDNRGWLMGSWLCDSTSANMTSLGLIHDPVSMWHRERSIFGMADGHAELHKWTNKEVIEKCEAGQTGSISISSVKDQNTFKDDLSYMLQGYVAGKQSR